MFLFKRMVIFFSVLYFFALGNGVCAGSVAADSTWVNKIRPNAITNERALLKKTGFTEQEIQDLLILLDEIVPKGSMMSQTGFFVMRVLKEVFLIFAALGTGVYSLSWWEHEDVNNSIFLAVGRSALITLTSYGLIKVVDIMLPSFKSAGEKRTELLMEVLKKASGINT